MFPEGTIIICGVQIECRGNEATGEVFIDDEEISIPCCEQCASLLDSD